MSACLDCGGSECICRSITIDKQQKARIAALEGALRLCVNELDMRCERAIPSVRAALDAGRAALLPAPAKQQSSRTALNPEAAWPFPPGRQL